MTKNLIFIYLKQNVGIMCGLITTKQDRVEKNSKPIVKPFDIIYSVFLLKKNCL